MVCMVKITTFEFSNTLGRIDVFSLWSNSSVGSSIAVAANHVFHIGTAMSHTLDLYLLCSVFKVQIFSEGDLAVAAVDRFCFVAIQFFFTL